MKRSFYDILGVPQDADPAHIDKAYAVSMAKFSAANTRGVSDAGNEAQLIRDGYAILSDAKKRALYNAKLMADQTGVKLMFFPEGPLQRRKLGVHAAVLFGLVLVLSGIVYHQMTNKMQEVRIEHVQAVARTKDKQDQSIQVDRINTDAQTAAVIANEEPAKGAESK